jgi:hypothetical protein
MADMLMTGAEAVLAASRARRTRSQVKDIQAAPALAQVAPVVADHRTQVEG